MDKPANQSRIVRGEPSGGRIFSSPINREAGAVNALIHGARRPCSVSARPANLVWHSRIHRSAFAPPPAYPRRWPHPAPANRLEQVELFLQENPTVASTCCLCRVCTKDTNAISRFAEVGAGPPFLPLRRSKYCAMWSGRTSDSKTSPKNRTVGSRAAPLVSLSPGL